MDIEMKPLKDALAYLWSGWGPVASLLLFTALWEAGHQVYGSFILPSPVEAGRAVGRFFTDGQGLDSRGLEASLLSAQRAIGGFFAASILGTVFGIMAGLSMTAARAMRPIITVLLGIPPIAWIVLALLWFGLGGASAVFTVLVTVLPITFAGAMQGTLTLDRGLEDMARTYRTPTLMMLIDVHLPHVLSYLFPAWITALGMAWKITVMGELLSTDDGIGGEMALTRTNLDTAGTMGWILILLAMLLFVEYLILEPIKRRMEPWRTPSRGATNAAPKGF